jgi:hypothetical protein
VKAGLAGFLVIRHWGSWHLVLVLLVNLGLLPVDGPARVCQTGCWWVLVLQQQQPQLCPAQQQLLRAGRQLLPFLLTVA